MSVPPIQKPIQTLTIGAGQTAVLKSGVKIISVAMKGSVEATSTCDDVQDALDNAEDIVCFKILFLGEEEDGGGTGPFRYDNGDLKIMGFSVGSQMYSLDNFQLNGFSSNESRSLAFVNKAKDAMGVNPPIFVHSLLYTSTVGERDEFRFLFSAPASLGPMVYLKISTPSAGDPSLTIARFYAEACDDCCPDAG